MFRRLALIAAVAGTCATSAGARAERSLTLTVKSVETSVSAVDKAPKGMSAGRFSAGDVLLIRDDLFNRVAQLGRPAGARIGSDASKLTFVSATAARVVGSASFPGGTVTFRGRATKGATGTLAFTITGGSGRYAHARGTVTEPASDSDPKNATNTYHLTLP